MISQDDISFNKTYINLIDFFDVNNIEHLRSYNHMLKVGTWPSGFIDDNIEFNTNWMFDLNRKLAEKYIHDKLKEKYPEDIL